MYLFLILLLLVIRPDVCISGATKGLLLWFNTVLPTLFPFFVVTRLILSMNLIPRRLSVFYPVLTGLIAGYPTGAITVAELVKSGKISSRTGQHILIASNNASPGFLIGIAGALSQPGSRYTIWFCVIISSYIVALCSFILSGAKPEASGFEPEPEVSKNDFMSILETTIMDCAGLLVLIGGYIIIFSIMADYVSIIVTNELIKCIIAGVFEITCGVTMLVSSVNGDELIRGAALAFLCGFGGLSAIFQTAGAIKLTGLSLAKYIFHKIICATLGGALFITLYYIL